MIEYLPRPYLLAIGIFVLAGVLYYRLRSRQTLPDLPWLNTREGELLTILRARWRSALNYKQTVQYAYERYSKNEESCILPTLSGAHILLPTSSIDWIIYQPDNVLSVVETHRENLQTDLTFVHPFVVANPLHHETIKNELTRQLGALTTDIIDELSAAFDDIWGTDAEQWKDVCIFETIMQIVARTSNRVFVGPSLCRDGRMLEHAIGFATAIALASAVLGQIPRFLRPLAAPIITRPNQKHTKAFAAILRPEIERRQRCLNDQDWGSDKEAGETEPNDFLQWTVRRARESPFSVERDPDIIAERLLAVNFAAIHTSTFSVTNAVFDLVSSDPSLGYIEQLRDEAASTLARDNGLWTKQGISKMYKIDSTFRESSRLGSFLGVGLMRTVMSPDGVTAPNGTFCPYGSRISVPTNGVHNDPALYPDAAVYQPFRFSSQRGSLPTDATETKTEVLDTEDYLKKANLSFVSTSPAYHPFGHGRHACPGRFFAANELKLMLAYMVLNYDFEMIPERPESKWMGATLVPPMKATVRVRRRV